MPEVSGAGVTEEECRERGLEYKVGRAGLGLALLRLAEVGS
jgi:hypothetical protein